MKKIFNLKAIAAFSMFAAFGVYASEAHAVTYCSCDGFLNPVFFNSGFTASGAVQTNGVLTPYGGITIPAGSGQPGLNITDRTTYLTGPNTNSVLQVEHTGNSPSLLVRNYQNTVGGTPYAIMATSAVDTAGVFQGASRGILATGGGTAIEGDGATNITGSIGVKGSARGIGGSFDAAGDGNSMGVYATGTFMGAKFVSSNTTGTAYGIQSFCSSNNCTAVYAGAPAGQTALYASGNAIVSGNATVNGGLTVNGYITKSGGGFQIPHPEMPTTHYLNHGFVESDVMRNEYVGEVELDSKGEAIVQMPSWYAKVNKSGVLFLTTDDGSPVRRRVINTGSWKLTGKPSTTVGWLLIATRNDPWAQKNQPPTVQAIPNVQAISTGAK